MGDLEDNDFDNYWNNNPDDLLDDDWRVIAEENRAAEWETETADSYRENRICGLVRHFRDIEELNRAARSEALKYEHKSVIVEVHAAGADISAEYYRYRTKIRYRNLRKGCYCGPSEAKLAIEKAWTKLSEWGFLNKLV